MPSPIPNDFEGDLPSVPHPGGHEIYNILMAEIEPELLTTQLPLLREKYKDETAEQSRARKERYEQAFAEYDGRQQAFVACLQEDSHAFRRQALASAEQEDKRNEESRQLSDLESRLADA